MINKSFWLSDQWHKLLQLSQTSREFVAIGYYYTDERRAGGRDHRCGRLSLSSPADTMHQAAQADLTAVPEDNRTAHLARDISMLCDACQKFRFPESEGTTMLAAKPVWPHTHKTIENNSHHFVQIAGIIQKSQMDENQKNKNHENWC